MVKVQRLRDNALRLVSPHCGGNLKENLSAAVPTRVLGFARREAGLEGCSQARRTSRPRQAIGLLLVCYLFQPFNCRSKTAVGVGK